MSKKIAFVTHYPKVPELSRVSEILRRHGGYSTQLWLTEDRDLAESFNSRFDVVESLQDHRIKYANKYKDEQNIKWLKAKECALGERFVNQDIAQDRYLAGIRSNNIKLSNIPINTWSYNKCLNYVSSMGRIVEDMIRKRNIEMVYVEMTTAVYRLIRRVCWLEGIEAVHIGNSRLWENGVYLEKDNYFGWQECVNEYRQIRQNGVPEKIQTLSSKRLNKFKQERYKSDHSELSRGGTRNFRSFSIKSVKRVLKHYWRSVSDGWQSNPRIDPLSIVSPWARVKRLIRRRVSRRYYERSVRKSIDISQPFGVYFLHVQPEATVDAAAFEYRDQAATIRNIAAKLPTGVSLLVKEHMPMAGRRSSEFYAEINHIPNVELIDDRLDSHYVIQKANFTVTLTGTVGLESLLYGKPSFVLGKVFFSEFDGIWSPESYGEMESMIESLGDAQSPKREEIIRALSAIYVCSSFLKWPPESIQDYDYKSEIVQMFDSACRA